MPQKCFAKIFTIKFGEKSHCMIIIDQTKRIMKKLGVRFNIFYVSDICSYEIIHSKLHVQRIWVCFDFAFFQEGIILKNRSVELSQ